MLLSQRFSSLRSINEYQTEIASNSVRSFGLSAGLICQTCYKRVMHIQKFSSHRSEGITNPIPALWLWGRALRKL